MAVLHEGDAAPDFVLKDADGSDVRLSSFSGKAIVLYFYPKDNTRGCTIQAKRFRDRYPDIAAQRATVVGVSLDRPEDHCAFRDLHSLPFVLLADPEGRIHDLYDAWRTTLFGRRAFAVRRCTYIIDDDGIIRSVHRNVNVFSHAQQVVRDLARMSAQKEWKLHKAAEKERKRREKASP